MTNTYQGLETVNGEMIIKHVIKNGETLKVGSMVKLDGVISGAGAGDAIYGTVVGFVSKDGLPIQTDGVGGDFRGEFTAKSDNETVDEVSAVVDIALDKLYVMGADATLGTTAGSDLAGKAFDLADADTIDESTVGTGTQVLSHGKFDDSHLIISIKKSQLL